MGVPSSLEKWLSAVVLVLVSGLLMPASHAQSTKSDSPTFVSLTRDTIWPDPRDRGDTTTVSFQVDTPGTYSVSVQDQGAEMASHEFGRLLPRAEPYTWTWNGRTDDGRLARAGKHILFVYGRGDDGYGLSEFFRPIDVRYSTEEVSVLDPRERQSRHVDVKKVTLRNAPEAITARLDFRRLEPSPFWGASISLEVDKAAKGYIVSTMQMRSGRYRSALILGYLRSDQGRPQRVRCPGLRTRATKATIELSAPRNCLKKGGRKARAFFTTHDEHFHYDQGPLNRNQNTPWTTYDPITE
ncbi:hypothetical protein [Nocardioides sp. 616]|uniref:hypothetical protein n=1 Tax=Nocardioides sp. 616 TaxID=2268090 RepID=UPI0013B40CD5|nr:hypothetical protein [Nocardioides sp. 616]